MAARWTRRRCWRPWGHEKSARRRAPDPADGVTYDILYDILIKQNGDIHGDWDGTLLPEGHRKPGQEAVVGLHHILLHVPGDATVTVFVPYDCKNHCPFCINKGEYADLTGFSAEKIRASIRRMDAITPYCDFVFTGGAGYPPPSEIRRREGGC